MHAALPFAFAASTTVAGAALVVAGLRQKRSVAGASLYLREVGAISPVPAECDDTLRVPLSSRVLRPLGRSLQHHAARFLPAGHVDRLRHTLVLAGRTDTPAAEDLVAAQAVLAGGGLVLGLAWSLLVGYGTTGTAVSAALLMAIGGLGPATWISREARSRQGAIRRDLPDVLDLMAITVEAGLGLEAAMAVVGQRFSSPLAEEIVRTLGEIEFGASRREALQSLRGRTDVVELSTFVLSLLQADVLGSPLGRTLRQQADELRSKRRQWAREKAARLPVTILFPLVTLIFPAMFVVLLGPAAISISRALQ